MGPSKRLKKSSVSCVSIPSLQSVMMIAEVVFFMASKMYGAHKHWILFAVWKEFYFLKKYWLGIYCRETSQASLKTIQYNARSLVSYHCRSTYIWYFSGRIIIGLSMSLVSSFALVEIMHALGCSVSIVLVLRLIYPDREKRSWIKQQALHELTGCLWE